MNHFLKYSKRVSEKFLSKNMRNQEREKNMPSWINARIKKKLIKQRENSWITKCGYKMTLQTILLK